MGNVIDLFKSSKEDGDSKTTMMLDCYSCYNKTFKIIHEYDEQRVVCAACNTVTGAIDQWQYWTDEEGILHDN